jgi:hypothetical protein
MRVGLWNAIGYAAVRGAVGRHKDGGGERHLMCVRQTGGK